MIFLINLLGGTTEKHDAHSYQVEVQIRQDINASCVIFKLLNLPLICDVALQFVIQFLHSIKFSHYYQFVYKRIQVQIKLT